MMWTLKPKFKLWNNFSTGGDKRLTTNPRMINNGFEQFLKKKNKTFIN